MDDLVNNKISQNTIDTTDGQEYYQKKKTNKKKRLSP